MTLQKIERNFTVCKVETVDMADFSREFVFLSKTNDEISLVCESDHVPIGVTQREPGWKALKISGILDFSLIGVIAKISGILADEQIGIFIISTYNTDYILIKETDFGRAIRRLENEGYTII